MHSSLKLMWALGIIFFSSFGCLLYAQEIAVQHYNPNSVYPIPLYEQLYRIRTWRSVDLREKQNKGFFARGNEISAMVIEAVKSGEISSVYYNDSLVAKMPKADFLSRLVSQQGEKYPGWTPYGDWYEGDRVSYNGKNYEALVDSRGSNPEEVTEDWEETSAGFAVEFLPFEIYKMTLQEDLIFDRRRSRLYYDIQGVQFSAFDGNTGTFKSLGWFKYKDLEKLFRDNPQRAVWFNRQNVAEDKNYADAFLLRLFHGILEKIQNPDNESIYDTYTAGGRPYIESVWAREWEDIKLMEREHNLWEY